MTEYQSRIQDETVKPKEKKNREARLTDGDEENADWRQSEIQDTHTEVKALLEMSCAV